jgi:hypothetical protein
MAPLISDAPNARRFPRGVDDPMALPLSSRMGHQILNGTAPPARPRRLPLPFQLAVKRAGSPFSEHVILVSVRRQSALHFTAGRHPAAFPQTHYIPAYVPVDQFRISTSRFGIGQRQGSNCTPLGLHRVADRIGQGWPVGTVFKSRKPCGYTWTGSPNATITTRILWLEGMQPGINRGGRVDSHARYIYIHGTGNEPALGRPASCGCIHLAAEDLMPLFDELPLGTLVWIEE